MRGPAHRIQSTGSRRGRAGPPTSPACRWLRRSIWYSATAPRSAIPSTNCCRCIGRAGPHCKRCST
ncbi:hypothetical protein C6A85_10215, partial [Mycobacterium sp. ITM-2017-0098]